MSAGRLVVCPTPIGNLEDVTLRVLATLREADVVACEDTRHTRVLLDRHGIRARKLVAYHEHNERAKTPELVARIREGAVVALVSDAGMPAVSDPGWVLVRACAEQGLALEVLPGPSAVIVAVVASALPTERWTFAGFVPRRAGERERLWRSAETVVAFESPRRLAASLASLAAVDPERPVAICRELTKIHEEVVRGPARALAERYAASEPRGEIVVVVGAAAAGTGDEERAAAAVAALVEAGARPRAAAAVVAQLTGTAANRLYRRVAASSERPGRSGR